MRVVHEYPDDVQEIFRLLCQFRVADFQTDEQKKKGQDYHKDMMDKFLDMIEKTKQFPLIMSDMVQFSLDCVDSRDPHLYRLGKEVADNTTFNAKTDKALITTVFRRLSVALADENHDWNDEDIGWDLNSIAQDLVSHALDCVKDGRLFTWEEYDELIGLAMMCQQQEFVHPVTGNAGTVAYVIYSMVATKVISWLSTMNELSRAAPLVPGLLDLMDSEEEHVTCIAGAQLQMISRSAGNMVASYMDRLLRKFLEDENRDVLDVVSNIYEHNPGPMEDHFQDLFEHIDSGDSSVRSHMVMLVQKIAKFQPDLFTKDNMDMLMKEAKEDPMYQVILLMTIEEIAKRRPEKVKPYLDDLMALDQWQTMAHPIINRQLQFYALQSEASAQKIMDFMVKQVQTSSDQAAVLTAYNAIRLIGFRYRPTVEKHRATIEKLRDETTEESYRTCCVAIIDMLDGKSSDKIAEELKALQADVADIDLRVAATETTVTEVKDTVQRQGQDLDNVKNDVNEQGQRLDQVEETVEETVVKVEEIDGKTLSHAPFWSRDVSKLLNPEAAHDWRLLSSRLGYSNDDIRGWAQQADPCMAMLNEWYATHKTREATYAVLTALQDMNRMDAAIIVENAMKNAEAVVEDEEFEYASPPDVFISYQWSHQNEVRLLRQHLEMAGYSCWMDVGQMGGGDKLFEKIDSGIRAAKVVISCVTEKYAKSPNCNREVNLSVSLGKPIIPLLMEKTTWPPPGSMGPIFSEYLFIRFFQRGGEETSDQRYWPPDKFQELLMQLSMNGVTPDQDAVQPEYKDWWIPKIEEVIVDKNRAKGQNTSSAPVAVNDEKAATSPDVFISYQWGRQPQIVRLYRTLTSLGYTCWLDIMQMGGGDSLYDKIDRGLRGCRVVVSCVTPKYALSANCRREVSLADALRKPLIPILLETTSWPPPGPMGPILTQLLYIDCTSLQDNWTGPKFDELLSMINQHVPNMAPETAEAPPAAEEPKKKEAPPKAAAAPPTQPPPKGGDPPAAKGGNAAAKQENRSNAPSQKENQSNGLKKSKSCSIL
nr:hypothetical protein BaRGS_027925 [Batillaria attramentaria]